MFQRRPEPVDPIDAALLRLLRTFSCEWEPVDDEGRDFFRSHDDIREALTILTVGGAMEQRVCYTLSALGDTRRVTFRVEICGDFRTKLPALRNNIARGVWPAGTFVSGPGVLEAVRVTANGKRVVEDYDAIGIISGLTTIQRFPPPGRVVLIGDPTLEDSPGNGCAVSPADNADAATPPGAAEAPRDAEGGNGRRAGTTVPEANRKAMQETSQDLDFVRPPVNEMAKRRGRKKADYEIQQREAAIAVEWQEARDAGTYKGDFARDKGMKIADLDRLLERVAKRQKPSE